MPLVNCPDCGKEISPSAPSCPHCGRPQSLATPPEPAAPPTAADSGRALPQKRVIKQFLTLCVLLTIALFGYVAAGPFLTIHEMKSAVREHDSEKLSSCIDFPALRSNLKDEFNELMMQRATPDLKNNPFGALGMALASTLVDSMVNSFITPAGLTNLMAGQRPQQPADSQQAATSQQFEVNTPQQPGSEEGTLESNGPKQEPFQNSRYTYDSPSKFSAWVKNNQGEDIRFVFTRDGLTWRLSNIVIPLAAGNESSKTPTANLGFRDMIRQQNMKCESVVGVKTAETGEDVVTCQNQGDQVVYKILAGANGPVIATIDYHSGVDVLSASPVSEPAADDPALVREQKTVMVDGKPEIWRLQWDSKPSPICGVEEADVSLTCPCSGFAYAEQAPLALIRIRSDGKIERLQLGSLFQEGPGGWAGSGRAVLQRWAPVEADQPDNDSQHMGDDDFAARVAQRPLANVMQLADFDHDGQATEFLFQVATLPCGKHQMVLVGISKANPHLHIFSSQEDPNEPLILGSWEWQALRDNAGPVNVVDWNCGDHGSDEQRTVHLSATAGSIHVAKSARQCPNPR